MESEKKYDVAFSFCDQDHATALKLADSLRDRFTVFVYSERQREIGGKDGVTAFSKVFGEEARVVVVLFRPEWGESRWTRVEQDAIRDRSFEEGWDFCIFVPLVEKPSVPPWFPKRQLYLGLNRWGLAGVCGVIEQRVIEAGGSPSVIRLEDLAAKKLREQEHEQKRHAFRQRPAVAWAEQESRRLLSLTTERNRALSAFRFQVTARGETSVLVASETGTCLHLGWHARFTNSLDGASLGAVVNNAHPDSNLARYEGAQQIGPRLDLLPDLGLDTHPAWFTGDGRVWTLEQVVEEGLKLLVLAMPKRPN